MFASCDLIEDERSANAIDTPATANENVASESGGAYNGLPLEASSTIGNTGVKLTLRLIQPGTFQMGSDTGASEEKPVHEVIISKPFYLGKFEVTQAQYEAVIGKNPSEFKGANNPVEQVNRDDAEEFCQKLSQITGENYRLPTEAEWEYAARAGTTTKYYWGESDSDAGNYAWYEDNSGYKPHPVGQKQPNPWGLYDMSGNVWEWCSGRHYNYPSEVARDPQELLNGDMCVYRGGCWYSISRFISSANRGWSMPASSGNNIGFRIVKAAQ
jgi:formylglycine-generating enzyme required for sulfatase activity